MAAITFSRDARGFSRLNNRRNCRFLFALLTFAGLAEKAQADGVVEILGALKQFRDGTATVFDVATEALKKEGKEDRAKDLEKWSGDWLSLLGISTGLTGLAKDFVLNYLGRSNYHDSNGPLIDTIKELGRMLSVGGGKGGLSESDKTGLTSALLALCKEGKKLFSDGAIRNMLIALEEIVRNDDAMRHLMSGLKNDSVSMAFSYMGGARPHETIAKNSAEL